VNACTAVKPSAFSEFGKFQYPPHKYGRPKIVVTEGEKTVVGVVGAAVVGLDPEDGAAVPVEDGSVEVGLLVIVRARSIVVVNPESLIFAEYLVLEPGASIIQ
jgi:hypothetical protein